MFDSNNRVDETHAFLPSLLSLIPVETKSLLDLGCGRGIVGAISKVYRDLSIVVGFDLFKPYLCRSKSLYSDVVLGTLGCKLPFRDSSFEIVTCIEVLEHLDKKLGVCLLAEFERIATKRIIVTTPFRHFKQSSLDGNLLQEHVSHYEKVDFEIRGYNCYKSVFNLFGKRLEKLSLLINKMNPAYPVNLIAVKDVKMNDSLPLL